MGDPLSQDEIDKLLAASQDDDGSSGAASADVAAEAVGQPEEQVQLEMTADEASVAEAIASAVVNETPESVLAAAAPPREAGPTIIGAQDMVNNPPIQAVEFGSIPNAGGGSDQPRPIDLLLDVRLQLTVELGRKDLTIKDALALGPGSVVELDRVAGDPVDLFVNNKLIARGEVVVIDENFGIRVTEVVSPAERIGRAA